MRKIYHQKINDVIENTSKRAVSVLNIESRERLNFLRFKSAVKFLNPNIECSIEKYNGYLLNRELSNLEINHVHLLEKNGFSKLSGSENIESTPSIYCSFHMGSYISVCYYLVTNNINFSIVVGEESYDAKRKTFLTAYYKTLEIFKDSTSKMEFINGQTKNSIISMIKSFKRGNSLLFYIDGNKGIKEFDTEDNNLIKIKFLNAKIYSRKGIAFLSHYLNVPIIPIISYRESASNLKSARIRL